eukprot:1159218-Pelagomonas_calceolata.AAC.6
MPTYARTVIVLSYQTWQTTERPALLFAQANRGLLGLLSNNNRCDSQEAALIVRPSCHNTFEGPANWESPKGGMLGDATSTSAISAGSSLEHSGAGAQAFPYGAKGT